MTNRKPVPYKSNVVSSAPVQETPAPTPTTTTDATQAPKPTKALTLKQLRKAASGKVSATAFLQEHASRLAQGDIDPLVHQAIADYEAKKLLPSATLDKVKSALDVAIQEAAYAEANDKIEKARARGAVDNTPKGKYLATIYDPQMNVVVVTIPGENGEKDEDKALVEAFELPQRAEGWAERRLVECEVGCVAVIVNTHSDPNLASSSWMIHREGKLGFHKGATDSIFKEKPRPPNPNMSGKSKGSSGTKWQKNVTTTMVKFSRG